MWVRVNMTPVYREVVVVPWHLTVNIGGYHNSLLTRRDDCSS